jgi:uroporphyrin-3 C-methyltransferase
MIGETPVNPADEEKVFDPFEMESEEKSGKRSAGAAIAWLALLIALAAAAASGWLWWLDWQGGADHSEQVTRLAALQSEQSGVRERLMALESRLERAEQIDPTAALAPLQQSIASLEQAVGDLERDSGESLGRDQSVAAATFELQQSLEGIEATLAALTVRSDTPGQRLDMYEVESLLRLAAERLQLFAEVTAADEALVLADERLAAMGDPVYLSVRQRIARARQVLAEVQRPDAVQIEGRISALQDVIPRLPFPGERVSEPEQEEAPPEGLWQRFKQTVAGLVTVRRKTAEDEAQLTIGDKDYLRQGLWLQLETARLAMMRRDVAVYQASLNRASNTLEQFFDRGAARVTSAIDELAALSEVPLNARLPDISAPWSQLQLLRQSAAQPPADTATEDPASADPDSGPEDDTEAGG